MSGLIALIDQLNLRYGKYNTGETKYNTGETNENTGYRYIRSDLANSPRFFSLLEKLKCVQIDVLLIR